MVECCGAPQPGLWFAVSVPGPFWMSIFSMQDIPHVLDSHAGGLLSLLENSFLSNTRNLHDSNRSPRNTASAQVQAECEERVPCCSPTCAVGFGPTNHGPS